MPLSRFPLNSQALPLLDHSQDVEIDNWIGLMNHRSPINCYLNDNRSAQPHNLEKDSKIFKKESKTGQAANAGDLTP